MTSYILSKIIKSVFHNGVEIIPKKIEIVNILSKFSSSKKPSIKIQNRWGYNIR
jgi:hypothetical protein